MVSEEENKVIKGHINPSKQLEKKSSKSVAISKKIRTRFQKWIHKQKKQPKESAQNQFERMDSMLEYKNGREFEITDDSDYLNTMHQTCFELDVNNHLKNVSSSHDTISHVNNSMTDVNRDSLKQNVSFATLFGSTDFSNRTSN
ncbi:unnamed protein product [Brachionus calyciflorus]|uniref:Uncharacterized protein n=1 Tax=Brachionus calyciflorus TaxID=104777 RepID=A0A814B606_9BILA|nr:unnamed protein product [Brachionus calyciflorus]